MSPCRRSAKLGTVLVTASRITMDDWIRERALSIIPEVTCPKRITEGVTSGVVAAGGSALPCGVPALGSTLDAACALCATSAAIAFRDAEMPAQAQRALCLNNAL